MSAFQTLKDTALKVRLAREKQKALTCSTIIGELETTAKTKQAEVTDENVYAKYRKTINTNNDNIKLVRTEAEKDKILAENEFLQGLLPQELTEAEIVDILTKLAPSNMGEAMKHLNANYTGKFNGGLASKVAREITSK